MVGQSPRTSSAELSRGRAAQEWHRPILTVPLSPSSNIRALMRAGADAFYCGLIMPELRAMLFGWSEETGRASPEANFDESGLRRAIELCKTFGRPLYLTLNRQYPSKVVPGIKEVIAKAIEWGVSGLVVADLGIAAFVHENWPHVHMTAGTFMGLHNPGALGLASRMGISRVVLPRVMRLEEIRLLSSTDGPGLEVFVGRERCRFLNAYCRLEHSMPGNETKGLNFRQAGLCATPMTCEGIAWTMCRTSSGHAVCAQSPCCGT